MDAAEMKSIEFGLGKWGSNIVHEAELRMKLGTSTKLQMASETTRVAVPRLTQGQTFYS